MSSVTSAGARSYLSSVFTFPLENEVLLLDKKKYQCSLIVSKTSFKMGRISCKVSENEIEGNSSSSKVSFRTKNRMEEYNTAMKKMMRNPYEYHHDLGQCYRLSFFFHDFGYVFVHILLLRKKIIFLMIFSFVVERK